MKKDRERHYQSRQVGLNLEEIAINLRALSAGITNAVKLAYIEKDKSLTREFQTALQGTTRKETLLRLKDWVVTAPSGSPASKLFDEQAQESACWLEWAALEGEKETNAFRKAQASIEMVRYWRDVAVLLKDYPDQVTAIAGGRNYDQVVEVLNQSATSAMRSSDQVSEIEARLVSGFKSPRYSGRRANAAGPIRGAGRLRKSL